MGKNSYDLTSRGATIVITPEGMSPIELKDFADDQDPLMLDDITLGEAKFDINGKLYRAGKLEPISCHIALIPDSEEEKKMNSFVLDNMPIFGAAIPITTMDVTFPMNSMRNVTFSNGFIIGATPGKAITSEGRVRTKNYSFAFKSCERTTAN